MTALSDSYRDIADRHLIAAKVVLDAGHTEIATFHCYHALESIACAAICLRSTVPLRHAAKIQRFGALYRHQRFMRGVEALALSTGSLRNATLYPSPALEPRADLFTRDQASRLLSRVDGAVRSITSQLGL